MAIFFSIAGVTVYVSDLYNGVYIALIVIIRSRRNRYLEPLKDGTRQ